MRKLIVQKPDSVCMKFLLPNWRKNRYDLIRKPTGYKTSYLGNKLRAKLHNIRSGVSTVNLNDYVAARQEEGVRKANKTSRKVSDVALTPPKAHERINRFTTFNKKFYFDVCQFKPNFEKKNDFDAEI